MMRVQSHTWDGLRPEPDVGGKAAVDVADIFVEQIVIRHAEGHLCEDTTYAEDNSSIHLEFALTQNHITLIIIT